MSALVHDSPDRAVTAIEPLTGSDNCDLETSHDLLPQSHAGLGCSVGRPSASRLSIQVRQTYYGGHPPLGGAPPQLDDARCRTLLP
ncbi:hypothetical protein N7541_009531 [Penicillium brevicompactum]|uniref:Uncharacterized protein n=1 Tax=Penicillium brevicompactum TaxID=5074 RepID=A0A9W9QLQ9_PENBR|nr:hypothetical protein N7541_009531 [Penicillium brevicompactum]